MRAAFFTVTGKPAAAGARPLPAVFDWAAAGVFCLWAAVILALLVGFLYAWRAGDRLMRRILELAARPVSASSAQPSSAGPGMQPGR